MNYSLLAYPIKLDDERPLSGIDSKGDVVTFSDYLQEGDKVGPEFEDGGEAIFTDGIVVKRDDGLWVEALSDERNAE